jgi:hypothetical protein
MGKTNRNLPKSSVLLEQQAQNRSQGLYTRAQSWGGKPKPRDDRRNWKSRERRDYL